MVHDEKQRTVPRVATSEIAGLPETLPPGTAATLLDGGTALALGIGERLAVYQLSLNPDRPRASEPVLYALPGNACGIAESALGALIAAERSGRSTLSLLRNRELVSILEFSGKITALAAAGTQAYVVILEADGRCGRLAQVNVRQRALVTTRSLDHAQMKLAVDAAGGQVILTDRIARTVISLGSDLRPKAVAPVPARSETNTGAPPERIQHDACCCCPVCKPAGTGEPSAPLAPPDHQPPAQHPGGRGPEHNGDAAVPTGDGGTAVGNGDRVDHYPPAGVIRGPCGRSLFYTVADMQRAGPYILASDRSARHVALLSTDMNLLNEWQFPRGGALLLSAEGASTLVMHVRGSGKWLWHDVHDVVARHSPYLDIFPLLPVETKTFIGQQVYALSHGQQPAPDAINGLLLPIIEGDQSFGSANLNGFGGFMSRTMLPLVKDYYDENSFGTLQKVSVSVFGVDLVPGGGPLKLPRPKLADYFWPKYEPARVEFVKNGVDLSSQVVLDGRESLTIDAKPLTGGPAGGPLVFPFFALAFQRDDPFFPSQVKFLGTETLALNVTMPDGTAKTLTLTFPATVIDFVDDPTIAAQLNALSGYLDGVMKAAEVAAGIGARLFAAPKSLRIPQIGGGFGRLLVTFSAANLAGNRLRITGTSSVDPGGDPMGLDDPILGTIDASDTFALARYFENAALAAQEAAGFGYNDRRLNDPTAAFDGKAKQLTTIIAVSDRYGGPGADVHVTASSGLETLSDSATAKPNSATTNNDAEAVRDTEDLFRDVFSAALQRLRDAGQPTDALKNFGCLIVLPLEPAAPDPANPDAVLPSEVWNVAPLFRPFDFRGVEHVGTIHDRKDYSIQLQSAWTLVFMTGGIPDNPMICHELGHALGYGDLYKQDGYRDELAYLDKWAMMSSHPPLSHHCGYHKLQSGWIPDGVGNEIDYGRVFPLGLPDPAAAWTKEILLVPIELWRETLAASARAAFGVDDQFPVAQLGYIDFGGDGSVFGLIEARQPGAHFSHNLPGDGGIIITNCITWTRDERIVIAGRFRRSAQLLNPDNILRKAGDAFDLAFAAELAVKGMKLEVVDKKVVEGDAQVFRIKVTRENAEFADVYFETGNPYWKSPDLWVDWMGDNLPPDHKGFSNKPEDHQNYGLGQPTDQGEKIRVQPAGATAPDGKPKVEPHWLVGRVRNRGTIKAVDVKINFYYYEPPGGGDGGKPMDILSFDRYKLIGTLPKEEILGRDDPAYAPKDILMQWNVPPGFGGHTCLYVHIEDSRVPEDSTGAVLGTADIWGLNNAAQKNVDQYEALSGSPFAPIEFDFSVHNAGMAPERAYIEPDGLPYGMKLTVSPPQQKIASGRTGIFHCTLELDERIIRTGCENDQRFRIHAWRQDPESSARWGGVEYEIRPREKTTTTLTGSWGYSSDVELHGTVTPAPGGGLVRIRLDYSGEQATWISVNAAPTGKFSWSGTAPASSRVFDAVAWFEGNRKFGSSLSNSIRISAPHPIN